MTIKTIESCIQSLKANGVNVADIMVRTPKVILDAFHLQSIKVVIDFACQADTSSTSSESCFGKFLEHMDVTETELDTLLAESEEDNLKYDPIDSIVQAIDSIHFHEPQCPILKLQHQLQIKNLRTEVLEQNPVFFEMFKQKLYKEFQGSLFWYWPLLQYVNIHDFQWQVMWLWEFLINTPTDEKTYEWLQMLINE